MDKEHAPCALCQAIADSLSHGGNSESYNTRLFDTSNFVVTPCIGPLVPGHVLISSKLHSENLANAGGNSISEVKSILRVIKEKTEYANSLITEHGSYEDQLGGACIVHCHLHVIPEMDKHRDVLSSLLPYRVLTDLSLIAGTSYPYILTMNFKGSINLYEAYNSHSQMMRKAICSALNRSDSDWKSHHDEESTIKTIQMWK